MLTSKQVSGLRQQLQDYVEVFAADFGRGERRHWRTRQVNLIATCCVLAWRIFWMPMINRSNPSAAPTLALTQLELDLLNQLRKPAAPLTTFSHYLDRIARLGGYLGRANDPPPGNIVMWRGLASLTDIAIGYSINAEKCG